MTIFIFHDRENEICLACREEIDVHTDLLPDDATTYYGLPLVALRDVDDQPIDSRYVIICDTADEFAMMMDE